MPCAFEKVFAIAPQIRIVSAFSISALITPILSETFAPPRMTRNGLAGFASSSLQIFELLLHQEPHGGLLDELRDACGRGVRAMSGAESVVHVKTVAELGE